MQMTSSAKFLFHQKKREKAINKTREVIHSVLEYSLKRYLYGKLLQQKNKNIWIKKKIPVINKNR